MKTYNYKDLENIFIDRISPKCKRALGSKILEPYPQAMIKKALAFQDDQTTKARYPFTNAEYEELTARGSWKAKEYPGLLYLVDIYISPFTVIGALMKKVYRTHDPMKPITVNLYSFEELSDEAQKKAINDMRNIHTNYIGWNDYIIEDFVNTLETYGLTDPKVEYTGFYSQGDGLSFTSNSIDLVKLMEKSGTDKTYPNFYKYIKDQDLDYDCYIERIERYYSHEASVILKISSLDNLLDPDEQRELCEKLENYLDEDYLNPEESEITELERELNRFIQRTARAMYQQLQTEYEYLSSDEYIIETIEAKDYLFTQDGNIY